MRLSLSCGTVLLVVAGAAMGQQKTVVPAFFSGGIAQTTDSSQGRDWARIANAGSAVLSVVPDASFLTLSGVCYPAAGNCGVCSPAGSPASCAGATGLCAAKCQFVQNHGAGQMVLGYVDTNFGCNTTSSTPATAEAGVNSWYGSFPTQIQGIFYDEGPTLSTCANGDLAGLSPRSESVQETDYDSIYAYVNSGFTGKVFLNASQFKDEWIMTDPAADYALTFEKPYNDWVNNYFADQNGGSPASWWTSTSYAGKLANVIFSDGTHPTQLDVHNAVVNISRSTTHGSPVLYLYDGSSAAYDHLACFFEQEVAELQNATPVAGKTMCSGSCVDLSANNSHCGSCSTSCGSGTSCCSAACINTITDVHNCGDCDNDCGSMTNGTVGCSAGSCTYSCRFGYHLCFDIPNYCQANGRPCN